MRILHLHSGFGADSAELRAARVMNAFGPTIQHSIVSAGPACAAVVAGIPVDYPTDFPSLRGRPSLGRLQRLARAMRGYDLILTYGGGAIDAVMAHTLFAQVLKLPPLVHHEDSIGEGELKTSRNWYRRIALGRAAALIVPSQRLEAIALREWAQPQPRVRRIPEGVAVADYGGPQKPDALPRVIKRKGEFWLGTVAELLPEKNLPRLVRAFSSLPEEWHLVILGDGPERDIIRQTAVALEVGHRVHLPGLVADTATALGLFDLFALSSDAEECPVSVIEAMAAGLAIASPDVGEIAGMVALENLEFIVPATNEGGLADAIEHLARDGALRVDVGAANRAKARAVHNEARMIAAYRRTYAEAMGRSEFP
jgi:glycosyltransferase involved in cell wall biosynthesis